MQKYRQAPSVGASGHCVPSVKWDGRFLRFHCKYSLFHSAGRSRHFRRWKFRNCFATAQLMLHFQWNYDALKVFLEVSAYLLVVDNLLMFTISIHHSISLEVDSPIIFLGTCWCDSWFIVYVYSHLNWNPGGWFIHWQQQEPRSKLSQRPAHSEIKDGNYYWKPNDGQAWQNATLLIAFSTARHLISN